MRLIMLVPLPRADSKALINCKYIQMPYQTEQKEPACRDVMHNHHLTHPLHFPNLNLLVSLFCARHVAAYCLKVLKATNGELRTTR